MNNFTPLNKQSKKSQKEFYSSKRNTWNELNPITRVVPNKKAYNRKKQPKDFGCFDFSPCIIS